MNVGPLAKGKDITVLRSKDGSRQKRRDYKKNLRKAIGEYLERREFGISDGYTTSPHFVQEWTGFRDLVYSPWWSRCWVVQELIVAQDATTMYGDASLTWRELQCMKILISQFAFHGCFMDGHEDVRNSWS